MNALRRPPRDRYYRGNCAHGSWFALLLDEVALVPFVEISCPAGCTVTLTTMEPLPMNGDG